MLIPRRKFGHQLIQHEAVQGVAPIVDIACIAAYEGGGYQKRFPRRNVCLERWNIPYLNSQLGRSGVPISNAMKVNSPDTRELPSHIEPVRHANLHRQPWHGACAVRWITGKSQTRVSTYTLNQGTAFRGGVTSPSFDPPRIH